jgi:DNA helicase-2/ATP-dependent DNA helicase PcrA
MKIHKVFGPPGSGKTTYLLNLVEQELENAVPSRSIGYFAFTRKAANEAKDRAIAKFNELNAETDFPWFRTLHSLAYRCLQVSNNEIMKPEHYREFARSAGLDMTVSAGDDEFVVHTDNPILNEINLARIRGIDLKTHYNHSQINIEWFHFEYVERAYRHYKYENNLMDFTDLLEQIVQEPEYLPRLEVLIVDEAQDLSRLQWEMVIHLAQRANRTFIAGDDDQAVYTWAGADVKTFLSLEGDIKVLEQSYRVPAKIHDLANRVVRRIRSRQPKEWHPREEAGLIQYYEAFDHVDVSTGEWLILASTNYMLNDLHEWLRSQGLMFERHGQRSISENILTAVLGWEALRKGKAMPMPVVKTVYKHLGTEFVQRGFKTLRDIDPNNEYTLEELKASYGLLTDDIWHKVLTKISDTQRQYIISILRRGSKLMGKVPIKLSTIHGAKGGEADNVMLLTDLSPKFAKEYAYNADDVNRLLYVGLTRAKESLHIIKPKNIERGFRIE